MDTYQIGSQPVQQPALTWMILLSAAAHTLLVVGLGLAPYFKPRHIYYAPTYMVSLVDAGDLEGEQAPPAHVPAPAPAKQIPPPPKPKPKVQDKKTAATVSKEAERPKKPAMQLLQEGKEKAPKPPEKAVDEPEPQSSYKAALSQIEKRLAERSGHNKVGGRRGRLAAAGPGLDLTPYDAVLAEVVRSNWIKPETLAHLDEDLVAVVVVRIRRSGAIAYFEIDGSSGNEHFDDSIRRVLKKVVFPPLPAAYPGEFYERHLRFHSAFITREEGVGVEARE